MTAEVGKEQIEAETAMKHLATANGFGGFKGDAQELAFAPDSKTLARSITVTRPSACGMWRLGRSCDHSASPGRAILS